MYSRPLLNLHLHLASHFVLIIYLLSAASCGEIPGRGWRCNFGGLSRTTESRTVAPTERLSCYFKVNADKNNEGYVEQPTRRERSLSASFHPFPRSTFPYSLHAFTYLSFVSHSRLLTCSLPNQYVNNAERAGVQDSDESADVEGVSRHRLLGPKIYRKMCREQLAGVEMAGWRGGTFIILVWGK